MPVPVLPGAESGGSVPVLSVAERTPTLELRATWRPERYTRIPNGDFATDATGWSVSFGINAAGVSVVRTTDDAPAGYTASGRVVTDAVADSGVNADLGSQAFYSDAGYSSLTVVRLWLKRESGGRRVRIVIGSEGTPTARASLAVDLLDEMQEYILTWRPQTTVSDAQLAVVTDDGQAVTFLVGGVRVYSPSASQVDNGSFLTDTAGWVTDGSLIAGSATSLTRVAGDGIAGDCAEMVTDGTAGSGSDFSLGGRLFRADMTHRLRIGLRAISGTDQVRLRVGSLGTPADRADVTATAGGTAWHTIDWTPSADRTDAVVSVSAGAATSMIVRISEVEVYEALDEVTPDEWDIVRGAAFDGSDVPGTMGGSLPDIDATYYPWHTSSPLYGSVRAKGVPMYARATHAGRARGLGWGRISAIVPDPYGEHVHLTTGDGLLDLLSERIRRPFRTDLSYAAARAAALDAAGIGAWQRDLDPAGPEAGTFFDGTDEPTPALQYLSDLCSATGTVHVADPSPHANVGWVYRTTNRARLTGDVTTWTIDDDSRGPLPGAEMREDTIITAGRRSWQGYELVRPAASDTLPLPWGEEPVALEGAGILAIGGDPTEWPGLVPYLAFTRPELGSFDAPEPEEVVTIRRVRGKKKRRRRLRWTEPLLPLTVAAGSSRTLEVEFSVFVEGMEVRWSPSSVDVELAAEPARATITITAGASDVTLDGLAIIGRAWLPTEEDEAVLTASAAGLGNREPSSVGGSDTYVSGPGAAEGVLRYLLWRYEESRLRPVVKDALQPSRMLGIAIGDRVSMAQTRYRLPSTTFAVAAIRHTIKRPNATDWHTEYTLEQLPADAGPWVVIGGGPSTGIGSGRRLAR